MFDSERRRFFTRRTERSLRPQHRRTVGPMSKHECICERGLVREVARALRETLSRKSISVFNLKSFE